MGRELWMGMYMWAELKGTEQKPSPFSSQITTETRMGLYEQNENLYA